MQALVPAAPTVETKRELDHLEIVGRACDATSGSARIADRWRIEAYPALRDVKKVSLVRMNRGGAAFCEQLP
jgi:hypothetical protein